MSSFLPATVILSAEALALRRARQAQRRAQKASLQLSQEQKELVQTLLGAHTRHVVPMFGQLVKFRVRTYRICPGCLRESAITMPSTEDRSPEPQSGQVPQPKTLLRLVRPKGRPRRRPLTHALNSSSLQPTCSSITGPSPLWSP